MSQVSLHSFRQRWLRTKEAADRLGISIRQYKRKAADPDDPLPALVHASPKVSITVEGELVDYQEAKVAAERGDEEGRRRLKEMLQAKRAILARQNGTRSATPSDANERDVAKTGAQEQTGRGSRSTSRTEVAP